TFFFSRASATKSAACLRSCGYSPLNTMSLPSGPKIWMRAAWSNLSAASISASAACCEVSKVLTEVGAFVGTGGFFVGASSCPTETKDVHKQAKATVLTNRRAFDGVEFTDVDLILPPASILQAVSLITSAAHHLHRD